MDNPIKALVERFKRSVLGNSSFQIEAHLKISTDDGTGPRLHFEKKNLIVNTGKVIVLQSLYPTTPADALQYAKVGNGGAIDVGGLFLKTPTVDQTDLYSPITNCSMGAMAVDVPTRSRVMTAVLDNSQANGYNINEVGFFSGNNQMFNIKTFPQIAKDSSFSINFQWTVKVL